MAKENILGIGILFMVIGSLFGWMVWMNTDRSETLVWESSKGENLLVKDDTRIETQEEMGVPERISRKNRIPLTLKRKQR